MFYKVKSILLAVLSLAFVSSVAETKAQGLVSLSEEAMFEDELDTVNEAPSLAPQAKGEPTKPAIEIPVVAPNAPEAAPKVFPKGPLAQQAAAPAPAPVASAPAKPSPTPSSGSAAVNIFASSESMDPVDKDLFEQMSDIEKTTALLNLELRREKLQNEIEAVKNQRRQAEIAEQEKAEAVRLKNIEAEKELERKLVVEQEKLRELDIQFETLRQEKILAAYKNQMLEENQKWIANNANFYKQIADLRQSKKDLTENTKQKMEELQKAAQDAQAAHQAKIAMYKKEMQDQQAQISILRSRIDTMEKEREESRRNPFAGLDKQQIAAAAGIDLSKVDAESQGSDSSVSLEPIETDLSKLYAVTEIRGQGGELIAKLINKNGTAFYVKKGTSLQSGHVISEITTTYVKAENAADKHYLYFAAGGILPTETAGFTVDKEENTNTGNKKKSKLVSSKL